MIQVVIIKSVVSVSILKTIPDIKGSRICRVLVRLLSEGEGGGVLLNSTKLNGRLWVKVAKSW